MIKSKHSTTVEINGKLYDTRTGKVISNSQSTARPAVKSVARSSQSRATMSDVSRSPILANNISRRTAAKSQTLMRKAVKRPAKSASIQHKSKPITALSTNQSSQSRQIANKLNIGQDIARQSRAATTKQNHLVSKFANKQAGKPNINQTSTSTNRSPRITNLPVQPNPFKTPTRAQHPAKPAVTKPIYQNQLSSVLEKSLRDAESHKQPQIKNKKRRGTGSLSPFKKKALSYGAGALALLLLVGFYGYQNIANLSMKYATTKAGISASLPSYRPSGFSLSNNIQYDPGQIVVKFASNSDERNFTITQKETTWNSDTLLNSYVSTKTSQPQKYEHKGRTIYLYGENSATWVNGGVWYDIIGDSELNSDQLIKIASSM